MPRCGAIFPTKRQKGIQTFIRTALIKKAGKTGISITTATTMLFPRIFLTGSILTQTVKRKNNLTDKSNFKSSIRVLIDELLSAEIVNEQPIDVENSTSTENKENPQKKRGQRAKMKMVDETALNGDL